MQKVAFVNATVKVEEAGGTEGVTKTTLEL